MFTIKYTAPDGVVTQMQFSPFEQGTAPALTMRLSKKSPDPAEAEVVRATILTRLPESMLQAVYRLTRDGTVQGSTWGMSHLELPDTRVLMCKLHVDEENNWTLTLSAYVAGSTWTHFDFAVRPDRPAAWLELREALTRFFGTGVLTEKTFEIT